MLASVERVKRGGRNGTRAGWQRGEQNEKRVLDPLNPGEQRAPVPQNVVLPGVICRVLTINFSEPKLVTCEESTSCFTGLVVLQTESFQTVWISTV